MKKYLSSSTLAVIGLIFFGIRLVAKNAPEEISAFTDLFGILGIVLMIVGVIGIFRRRNHRP